MDRFSYLEKLRIRRLVIKVGTSSITSAAASDGIDAQMMASLVEEIASLRQQGIEVILVSSGAVGAGRRLIAESFQRPAPSNPGIVRRQALSAIGQSHLMARYGAAFQPAGIPVAQLLLTARDFRDRRAYLNIGHAIDELQSMGALPIVNENDTVSTDELQFGDNDMLSAAVAALFRADLLVILTSVEGFLLGQTRLPEITNFTAQVRAAAGGPEGPGRGGMETKLRAGELCLMAGAALAILPARAPRPLSALLQGQDIGTLVYGATPARLSARKRWLLFARTEGAVCIDAGAEQALRERGSSLLAAGVRRLRGRFLAGDLVEMESLSGAPLGRGIINYSYREVGAMLGLSGKEIQARGLLQRAGELIHRNNLILERRD